MTCAGVPVGLDPHAIDIDPAGSIYLMGVPVPDAVLRASDETTSSPEPPRPDVTCSGGGDDAATPSFELGACRDAGDTGPAIDVVLGRSGAADVTAAVAAPSAPSCAAARPADHVALPTRLIVSGEAEAEPLGINVARSPTSS